MFVVRTRMEDDCVVIGGNWLFAFNQAGNGYRLSLPNLHDECTICTGEFEDSCISAHHHCSASAFQSGTDEENERGQDGLHITVGRMLAGV